MTALASSAWRPAAWTVRRDRAVPTAAREAKQLIA